MVETRNRKRVRNDEDECESSSVIDNAEDALEVAANKRARRNKQRRMESFARNHPPFELLSALIYEKIFLYLDSPRDVQSLACCAKYLRECLSPEIVIRASVFGGGKPKAALADVMDHVRRKTIHVPSTRRLLRLVNCTRCERGNQCFAYNHDTAQSSSMTKNSERFFGLAICPDCLTYTSYCCWNDRIQYPRRAVHKNRLLTFDYKDDVGEPAGPLVSGLKLKQLFSNQPQDEAKQALDKIYESIDEKTDPQDVARGEEFVRLFDEAKLQYYAFQEAKRLAANQKYEQLKNLRIERRRVNAQAVYEKLEDMFLGYPRNNLVLDCAWTSSAFCYFHSPISDAELGPLVRAPSTATNKKLSTAVLSVKQNFDLLRINGFLAGPGFLSFLDRHTRDDAKILYRYCLAQFGEDKLIKYVQSRNHTNIFTLIRAGKLFDALLVAIGLYHLEGAFVHKYEEKFAGSHVLSRANFIALARLTWERRVETFNDVNTEEKFLQKFLECRRLHETLRRALKSYKKESATVEFTRQTGPPPHRPNQRLTRVDALRRLYSSHESIPLLQSRDFAGLLRLQRRIFFDPSPQDLFYIQRPN